MKDHINRDTIKDAFCDACSTKKRYARTVEECREYTDSYGNKCFKMRLIDNCTATTDAQYGEWVYEHGFRCSVCKSHCLYDLHEEEELSAFCPNCGAKMIKK